MCTVRGELAGKQTLSPFPVWNFALNVLFLLKQGTPPCPPTQIQGDASSPYTCHNPPLLTTSLWDKPKPGSSFHFTTKARGSSRCHNPGGQKEQAHVMVWGSPHFTHACKPHGKCVTPLPGDEGLYNGQREQKMLFSTSKQKRAARRFYSSCQHPITNQQFALTTKLSKKRQRRGHLSDGLRRSQLFAQETAKKPQTSISRITFLLKHDKEENIWQKRPTRGKTEINRI